MNSEAGWLLSAFLEILGSRAVTVIGFTNFLSMGFSFRSMFQPSHDPQSQGATAAPNVGSWSGGEMGGMPNMQAPPLNAASPFSAAGPLFKTLSGESLQAAPVQASPFAVPSNSASNAPLTVGDVLPQLPPELARVNALAPDQPVAVSPQVLDAALRSGQAALPIFEIYRVCPALFQAPVSPQDPRLVPLPASKLPRLIASAQQQPQGEMPAPNATPASPFGMVQPASPSPSPFAAMSPQAAQIQAAATTAVPAGFPGQMPTALPPRRNGPPPPLADVQRETASVLSIPGSMGTMPPHGAPAFPTQPSPSPFGIQSEAPPAPPEIRQASPFSAVQPAALSPVQSLAPTPLEPSLPVPTPTPGSLLGVAMGAPSIATGTPAPAQASPFSVFGASAATETAPAPVVPPASSAVPGGVSAASSPFTSLFGPKAIPTGQPAPDAPSRSAGSSLFANASSMGASVGAGGGGPTVRMGLAALLRGYSVAELGFDPVMVPSWIMTSLPSATVKRWAEIPSPLAELGMLIDGINDVGFRNVLNNAKRDFQVRIPHEQIESALGGSAPPTLSNLSSVGTAPPASPPVMRVEPPASAHATPPPLVSPFASMPPPGGATSTLLPSSPFAQPVANEAVPTEMASPFSGGSVATTPNTFGQSLATPSTAPTFQASTAPLFPNSAAPITNPFAQAAPVSPPPLAPSVPPPLPEPVLEREVLAPAQVEETVVEAPPSPFRAPPKVSVSPEGFSSADLMGGLGAVVLAQVPPAPAIPVTNPFTGKNATTVVDVPEVPEAPVSSTHRPTGSSFAPPAFESAGEAQRPKTMVSPVSLTRQAPRSTAPALGIQSHESNPDQMVLRALLGSDEDLTPQRVVEMVCGLPGIAACVCLHGDRAISHAGAHKPQAREFQKQATELAHHLRSLAPLIGIDGAETFTLTSGDRLMTFCFPEGAILGVLHDADPSLGLRDKITLIARELSRMLG